MGLRTRSSHSSPGEDAVSPVVGVVLLVGITVVLFTTIAAVFLGYNATTNTPQAEFDFEAVGGSPGTVDSVQITHAGGQSIDGNQLVVSSSTGGRETWASLSGASDAAQGNSVTYSTGSSLNGQTLRVIFVSDTGSSGTVLATYNVPDP